MRTTSTRLVAVALATSLLLVACGDDDDEQGQAGTESTTAVSTGATEGSTTPPTTAAPEVCTEDRKGGEITIGEGSDLIGLDPTKVLGSAILSGNQVTALYDTLTRFDPGTGKIVPHLAESLEPNADRTEWRLKLRPGVKFGNGDPLTTAAVKFSIERLAKASVAAAQSAAEVVSMDIVDDLTMVLHMRTPTGVVPYFLATEAGMVTNPNVVNALGPEAFNIGPKGAGVGPYEFERFAPGEEVVLTAKDDYWGGPVCIQTLRFIYVAGARATYDAFKLGEMQMAFINDQRVAADAHSDDVDRYRAVAGGTGYFLNQANGADGKPRPTADLRVRQAFAYAMDPKVLNDRANGGTALPGSAVVDKSQRIYPGVEGPPYDPDKARQLVAEVKAGGWDGKLNLVCSNLGEQGVATAALMQAVGMDVELISLPPSQSLQRILFDKNFDTGCSGLSIFEEGPWVRLNQFASDSVRNRVLYKNPEMDQALNVLKRATTTEEVRDAIGTVQQIWNKTIPASMVWSTEWVTVAEDELKGLVFTRDGGTMFHHAYLE